MSPLTLKSRTWVALLLCGAVAACDEQPAGRPADLAGPRPETNVPDGPAPVPDLKAAVCGNNVCEPGEHCQSCPADCGQCQPQTHQYAPNADSYVDEGSPSSNYGTATLLYTDQSPEQQAVFRFAVTGVTAAVQSAKLRLHVTNGSSDGPAVYLTTDPWTEAGVTWANRPKPAGAAVADLGSIATGWLEIDVTSGVKANGDVSFVLVPTSTDGADVSSRESANVPELVVVTAGGRPPPPDAGPPTPDAGPPPVAFSFFVVGDTRSNPSTAQLNFQSMALLDPKAVAVFNSGDITADGEDTQWQAHEQAVNLGSAGKIRLDLTSFNPSYIRYFGVLGNHDIHTSGWLANWNKYLSGQQALGHNASDGIYYSVTYGNALFLVLDSEHSASPQTTWLQQELTAAAANPAIKWRFAFFHAPPYPCNYKTPNSSAIPWVRELEKHSVDMVFLGHAHTYERTCPMVGGKCQAGGVMYITSGGGGAETVTVDPTKTATVGGDSYDCSQILKVAKGDWHHYCHVKINGGTLTYACYPHTATTSPEDTLTLTK